MPKFDCILFPIDFSDRSKAAAPFVLSMAQRHGSKVVLVHAIQPPPPLYAGMNTVYPETWDVASIKPALEARLREFADAELPKVDAVCTIEIGDPAHVIQECAATHAAGLIAMPTHGYGVFRRALLGSVTAKVLHDSELPVWTSAHAPEPSHRAHPKPRHILTAIDLKPESAHVLEFAVELASESDATVEMVHVAREGEVAPLETENRMHELLSKVAATQPAKVDEAAASDVEIVTNGGDIPKMIREMALRKRIDLVVVGRGVIQSHFGGLKTNAYGIIREAPCPVISV